MTGDQSSYNEFVKLWQGTFTSSIGKMVNVSQLSMNRETLQTQMSSINAMITLINTLNEYIATLVKTSQDTLEKLIIDYRAMVIEGNNPKSYSEFYDYWWKQNEAAYLQLFGTPEFARLSGQLLEAGCNYKKNFDDLMERQLEFLPYPTKTDMDSLYKTVDTLKRDMRNIKKEFEGLKKYVSEALEED
jgi:chaperonin cofactor prefoldin